jgi:hypothetical protein
MPLDIIRQHAQEQVSANPGLQAVVDGTDTQVQALECTEGLFDVAQLFVRPHGIFCVQGVGRLGRADDIDSIERLLAGDGVCLARPEQMVVRDFQSKMLGDLVAVDTSADLLADL